MQINNTIELKAAILELKRKEAYQKEVLTEHVQAAMNALKPSTIIKDALGTMEEDLECAGSIDTAIGLGAGFLFKKIFSGKSPGDLRKAIVDILAVNVTEIAIQNADKIKTAGSDLFKQAVSFFKGFNKSRL